MRYLKINLTEPGKFCLILSSRQSPLAVSYVSPSYLHLLSTPYPPPLYMFLPLTPHLIFIYLAPHITPPLYMFLLLKTHVIFLKVLLLFQQL